MRACAAPLRENRCGYMTRNLRKVILCSIKTTNKRRIRCLSEVEIQGLLLGSSKRFVSGDWREIRNCYQPQQSVFERWKLFFRSARRKAFSLRAVMCHEQDPAEQSAGSFLYSAAECSLTLASGYCSALRLAQWRGHPTRHEQLPTPNPFSRLSQQPCLLRPRHGAHRPRARSL